MIKILDGFKVMKDFKKITLPTYFTLVRLIIAPFLVPFFIIYYLPLDSFFTNCIVAIIFLLFGFTDFLDGFLARRYSLESKIGPTLDHLADKILTSSVFIALLVVNKISCWWVIVFISRDFFIMGLREIPLEYEIDVRVSSWGKLKTLLYILSITLIIVNLAQGHHYFIFSEIETVLLLLSMIISLGSAIDYFVKFYAQLKIR